MPASGPSRWRIAVALPAVLVGVYVGGAVLTVILFPLLTSGGHGMADWIADKGPDRMMRRVMMVLVLPWIPPLLRLAGWRGWHDCGLSRDASRRADPAWARDAGLGLGIGLASYGTWVAASVAIGVRAPGGADPLPVLVGVLAIGLVQAAVIGLVEEIAMRGILFRSLSRLWSFWPAALASSLLFAGLHFLKASPDAFGAGGVAEQTGAVLASVLDAPGRTDGFGMRMLNLSLMGIVLCLFVRRTGTVWLAAGTHAAWVWLIRLNQQLLDKTYAPDVPGWWGTRSDGTDSPVTTLVFLALALFAVRGPRPRSEPTDAGCAHG